MDIDTIAQHGFGYPALRDMDYQTAHNTGEYLGHGIADDGREYEGYMVDSICYFFYMDDQSLLMREGDDD